MKLTKKMNKKQLKLMKMIDKNYVKQLWNN